MPVYELYIENRGLLPILTPVKMGNVPHYAM